VHVVNWNEKRVLVTGAGGFVGSHLTERLAEAGARVRAMVHYNAMGTWGWLDQSRHRADIDVVASDLADRDSVMRAMKGSEIVFHLGALIAIPYSYEAPSSYVHTNVIGTLNVLQAARDLSVDRIVHTSTSEVYGTAQYVPIDEKHPLQGQSPYSASKIGADKMAEAFHRSFGLPVVTLRPFNTFGPRQSSRAVIPTIISQCLAGDTVHLGSLEPTRDFIYVTDSVEGYLRAAVVDEAVGTTINIGSGSEISIGDLARLIVRMTGGTATIESHDERTRPEESEVERLLADSSLARSRLGWFPQVTLEDGLTRTIDWIRQNPERFRPGIYTI
jgi:NAD dependent epimerase/dehydratase